MNNLFTITNKLFKKIKIIDIFAVIIASILLLPILIFVIEGISSIVKGGNSLATSTDRSAILGTLKILFLTGFFGGGLGIINGWLLSNCEFRFRKILRICQLIPLAAPSYLVTAILKDLGSSMFGYQVTGLWWGVLILSISTYPYVFLLTNESFNKFGVNQINASRGLGIGPWKSFFKIALPMALPALATGISLMSMEIINELGTFELLNLPSISTGMRENWIAQGDTSGSTGLSLFSLLIVFSLIGIEKFSRRGTKRWSENPSLNRSQGWELKKIRSILAIVISLFPAIFSLGLPLVWIIYNNDLIFRGLTSELIILTLRTVGVGAIASILIIIFSLVVSLANRWNKTNLMKAITFMSGIGYAIPGTLLALMFFTLKRIFHISYNYDFVILIFGYVVRFLTISKGSLDSALERISPNLDEAATGLGASWAKVIRKIHIPILKGPIFVGSLLVIVDSIKELPIAFTLRPSDFDTLAVRVYIYAGEERLSEAILPAILIILLGLIASSTLIPSLEHNKD